MRFASSVTVLALLLATASVLHAASASQPAYRALGSFNLKQAGFLNLIRIYSAQTGVHAPALFISSFTGNPVGPEGAVYGVPSIGLQLQNVSGIQPELLLDYLWPNEVAEIPYDIFGPGNWLTVAGGFLVPGKATGAISAFLFDQPGNVSAVLQLTTNKKEYFYHMCIWIDMNGDGRPDLLSARATKPLVGSGSGELVWLENPVDPTVVPWKETTLFSGPDVFFRVVDLHKNGTLSLFAAEFFAEKIVVYTAPNASLTNPAAWKSRVVDDTIGPLFDLKVVDLNNDGRLDLLVTDHTNNETISGIYAYEIPDDVLHGEFVKHTLYKGFKTLQKGVKQASPGAPVTFHPQVNATNEKPSILLGGDGSQSAYFITPNSQDVNDWSYTLTTIIDVKNTVGQVEVGDVDFDGWAEFFVPDYDGGIVFVYTFAP